MAQLTAPGLVGLGIALMILSHAVTSITFGTCDDYKKECEVCNGTAMKCTQSFNRSADILREIPRGLEWISVTGNNFTDKLPTNLFGNCSKDSQFLMTNLVYLDLSNNNITRLHGKTFHCMHKLNTFILSHNNWHVGSHHNVFSSLKSLKRLILRNTFYEKLNGTGHLAKLAWYLGVTGMKELVELNLSGNEFWFMPTETHSALCALKNVEILDLSDNYLRNISLCSELDSLRVLNLSSNHLPFLGEELMKNISKLPKLEKLYLEDNLFQCDCGARDFYSWLKNETLSHAVQNRHQLKCSIGFNTVDDGRNILDLSLDRFVCKHNNPYNATGIVIGLLFAIIVVMFVVAMYYNRVIIKNTWNRWVRKPVTLSLIPQSQGYSTVDDQMRQL